MTISANLSSYSYNSEPIHHICEGGRTHLAFDADYLGSVETYGNSVSQLIASISKKSMWVKIKDQAVCVNKTSYLKLLHALGKADVTLSTLNDNANFAAVLQTAKFTPGIRMRDKISKATSEVLGKRLIEAIVHGKTARAQMLINVGAAIDNFYFIRANNMKIIKTESHAHTTSDLHIYNKYAFRVTMGTSIFLAGVKQMPTVIKQLKEFGANTEVEGHRFIFVRSRGREPVEQWKKDESYESWCMRTEHHLTIDKISEHFAFKLNKSLDFVEQRLPDSEQIVANA